MLAVGTLNVAHFLAFIIKQTFIFDVNSFLYRL